MGTLSPSSSESVGSKSSASRLPNLNLNFAGSSSLSTGGGAAGPFNFAPMVTIRLNNDNYLYWRAQVSNILRSHLLTGFVDGTFPCPSEMVSNPAVSTDVKAPPMMYNPEFTAWHQQDAALLSAIMSTSTEEVQGLILFASYAQDAWSTLAASFSSQSTARAMHLRDALHQCKKLDSTVSAYFNKDYDSLVQLVSARSLTDPMPIKDIYAQMLHTEQRVAGRKAELHTDMHMSANYGAKSPAHGGKQHQQNYTPTYPPKTDPRQQGKTAYKTTGGAPTGGGSSGGGGTRPTCQICTKLGHVASCCFKRFDRRYLGAGNDGRYMDKQIAAFSVTTTGSHGSTPSFPVDPSWYADTGATDHLTNELDKLHTREQYHGQDHGNIAAHGWNYWMMRLMLLYQYLTSISCMARRFSAMQSNPLPSRMDLPLLRARVCLLLASHLAPPHLTPAQLAPGPLPAWTRLPSDRRSTSPQPRLHHLHLQHRHQYQHRVLPLVSSVVFAIRRRGQMEQLLGLLSVWRMQQLLRLLNLVITVRLWLALIGVLPWKLSSWLFNTTRLGALYLQLRV
ncbi:hypothetical protein QYE76_062133 [Lolium multiflorum]|uniref:Retrotransposon Copia-like N-terminal domain-containing protein n=1 Tax=Lolium multiflorum TaxID=4521 RepID=A0AAD8W5V1_LOLMU|nr:hypothetical protein QYE76_062133 [Lolium multiflorum]